MISVKNISYQIEGKSLLNNISVDFMPGIINLIIGPNGAGKSTLIKILSGQIAPNSGEVFFEKTALKKNSTQMLAKVRAVLSQSMDISFPLMVAEVVMMGRYPHFSNHPTQKDLHICSGAMNYFGIEHLKNRNYMTLSGGEKQRVHFARVMAQIWETVDGQCRYLLLDEPLTFLDIYHQFDFMDKLTSFVKGKNIVVAGVVHDLNLAGKYADHITLINDGELFSSGNKQDVLTRENISTVYGLKPEIQQVNNTVRLHF